MENAFLYNKNRKLAKCCHFEDGKYMAEV